MGLWKNKYLVKRRDGTIPDWPWFVLSAKDPASVAALRAYADAADNPNTQYAYDPKYVDAVRELAEAFDTYREQNGSGDPDGPRHREDDPETVAQFPDE